MAVGDFYNSAGGPRLDFRSALSRTAAGNRAYGGLGRREKIIIIFIEEENAMKGRNMSRCM